MARISVKSIFFLFSLLGAAHTLHAQQDTSHYQLQGVEIFGKPAEVYAAGSRVSNIDSSFLSTYNSTSLAAALQARTPLYIKSYGVSGISSVSFRGTTASHTAVLWNGLNISSPSLGQADIAALPLGGVGAVAVQHGGAGATYGNGAIGGAILLTSPAYTSQGFSGELQQEAGSFGRNYSKAAFNYSNNKVTIGASGYRLQATNNFKYKDYATFGAPERRQDHAAILQYGFTQDAAWHISPESKLAFHTWYTFSDREPQASLGAAHNNSRQLDKNLRLLTEYTLGTNWGETSIKAAYFNDLLKYTNTSVNSNTDISTYQLQAEQTYTFGRSWSLRGGINLQHFAADVDGYGKPQEENRASAFALFRYDPAEPLELSLNLRQTFAEGYNPSPTPTLGANYKFYAKGHHLLYLKGNTSGSYRVPTLNDRFWQPGGNPDLKPEQGWNYESGLRHVYTSGDLLIESEATVYYMLVDNWIQWIPSEQGYYTPRNLQKVRSRGIELSSSASRKFGEVSVTATAGYTYTSSEQVKSYEGPEELHKQLAYVPLHKATALANASWRNWSLSGNMSYNGLRYTSSSNTTSLAAFSLLDLAASRKFILGSYALQVSAQANNLLNIEYQTMENLPMPGRNYAISLRFIIL